MLRIPVVAAVAFDGLILSPGFAACMSRHCESKANLKKGFLVLDIFGAPLRARKGRGLSMVPGGSKLSDFATREALFAKELKYGQSSAHRPTVRKTAFVRAVLRSRG